MKQGDGKLLMIAGGGTGGHIYPAVAVAREFVSRGAERSVVFVGTSRGLETQIVPRAGFPLELIDVGGLKGKSAGETLRNFVKLPAGFLAAWRLITRHRPAVIMGVGGYSSGPVLLAGALRGVPTLIHEQNAYPGITNRILAKFVDQVAVAFEPAMERLGRKGVVTGNPIRREFFETAVRSSGASGGTFRLLVFGGSQGSRVLNDAVTGALIFLARWKGRVEIVHQTGRADEQKVAEAYRASAFHEARVVPYLDPIVDEIAAADLVVCRAGAMTIGELCAVGRASILVPFALATNNHQEMNARVVEGAGGAVVLTEADLTPERLAAAVSTFLEQPATAQAMGAAAKRLAAPEATSGIVDLVDKMGRI